MESQAGWRSGGGTACRSPKVPRYWLRGSRSPRGTKGAESETTSVAASIAGHVAYLKGRQGLRASSSQLLRRLRATSHGRQQQGPQGGQVDAWLGQAQVASQKLLLEANAPINDSSESEEAVLHRAIHSGSKESVQLLLEGRANLEAIRASDEQSPLQLAVLDGYTGIAGLLLEWRASLDHTRADGMKPLHVAVCREATFPPRSGEGSVIKLLAEARADPQARSRTGMTPVALALSPGIQAPCRSAALRALIDIQADLNAALTPDGSRPLHAAVQHSLQGEAALLLECAADANVSRADGCTPLHLAAFTGSAPFVELLLGSRADASLTTQSGLTPLALARQHGFQALVRLLE
ncbi:unnamed protein product [Effrenium voratum]|nr:unnamed protein product [Effrenium voratum]